MNKCQFINPDKEKCSDRALQLFLDESGLGKEGERYERMRKDAFRVRDEISYRIDLRAAYSNYEDFALDGQKLTIGCEAFTCKAFEQIQPEALQSVWFYVVTAGDFGVEGKPVMDQLYADLWGNAFADAAREELMDILRSKSAISDSFGPGFYGMDTSEMKKMPMFVDFGALGIELKESGVLIPIKSCAGIVFKVNEKYKNLSRACEHCLGSKQACRLCSIRAGL